MFSALAVEDLPDQDSEPETESVKPIVEEKPAPKEKEVKEKEVKEEPGEFRIKSKKEKEREKKEKQKLLKKQQAAQKAAQKPSSPAPSTPEPVVEPAEPAEQVEPVEKPEDEDDDEDGKKKKKKKKKGKDEPAPKRKGPPVAALREAMLARQRAEEEAARLLALEQARIEEERRKAEEEERLKQEAKQRKREKEKHKKEELKKAGKYMTPAQKAAQAQAQAKLQALLASGVIKVEALEKSSEKPKRVVYDNRKKKKGQAMDTPKQAKEVKEPEPVKDAWDASSESGKDNWDASSEDEKSAKEAWDASSDDEKSAKEAKGKDSKEEEEEKDWDASEDEGVATPKTSNTATVSKSNDKQTEKKKVEKEEETSEESSEEDSEEDSEDEEASAAELQAIKRKEEAAKRKQERIAAAMAARSKDNLRSPICCILGHVDTGKTKLLDKIRQTNVQEGEAGGITQQIGATYFPVSAIAEKTSMMRDQGDDHPYKLPGLLMIDTPGHESFTNLRSRGSSLCNMAVLVVDIVHGLEPQTIESLNMLRQRKTPFIVALNKIDRLFDWEIHANYPSQKTLKMQKKHVLKEFQDRVTKTIVQFAEQGLNACLYWENKNVGKYVSLVPTSAVTGEGVPDLLHLLMDLTQTRMTESLMYLSELECTVLEVKVIEGLGTTIDVVLSNGVLNEGDRIVVCGLNGPIVTNIRALLTPQPMRELRVKSAYVHHKSIKAAMGVKISAQDLDKAVAGARLLVVGPDDDEEDLMDEVMGDLQNLLTSIDKSGKGVCVQASTLGSLEALLSFLSDMKIPVSGINIGPVHKKDIIRASIMLEKAPEYAQLLAFDVPVDRDAQDLAAEMGVKIFTANIIYHLFDKFTQYMKDLEEQKRKEQAPSAVFPCLLKMVPDAIFNKRSPIIMGVDVLEGTLKVGTPLCVVSKETGAVISLGKVAGIELNHKSRNEVKKGDPAVAIRVECAVYETPKAYGRHFTQENEIYSMVHSTYLDISCLD